MELSQQLEGLTDQQGTILKQMEDLTTRIADGDTEAKAQLKTLADQMAEIQGEREKAQSTADAEEARTLIAQLRDQTRSQSKASVIGSGVISPTAASNPDLFHWATWAARNTRYPQYHAEGKALLEAMGSYWQDVPVESKATLGDTATAGGNVVPPAVLERVVTISTAIDIYRNLMTFTDAGYVIGVSIPSEGSIALKAGIAAYGATKANLNFTANLYTATMYTLAAIYDVGNQLLRNSRGAAEELVRSRLTKAMALGEADFILNGTGTNQPKGLLPSMGTTGTYVTSFTASSTTLAGSSASAIAKATGALTNRARMADGVVCNASDFWIMASQGTDTAGFFFSPAGGPTQINPTIGLLRVWGLPVYADPLMPTDTMIVGEWHSATVYTGQTYRVDVTDTAGTRWDTNETGFRGEEEIAFNADPYVSSGMFQRVIDFTP